VPGPFFMFVRAAALFVATAVAEPVPGPALVPTPAQAARQPHHQHRQRDLDRDLEPERAMDCLIGRASLLSGSQLGRLLALARIGVEQLH